MAMDGFPSPECQVLPDEPDEPELPLDPCLPDTPDVPDVPEVPDVLKFLSFISNYPFYSTHLYIFNLPLQAPVVKNLIVVTGNPPLSHLQEATPRQLSVFVDMYLDHFPVPYK